MASLRITAGAYWLRGGGVLPRILAVELAAQAAAVLLSGENPRGSGYLAGVEEARWSGELFAGDDLEAIVRLEARLGPVAKVEARLLRKGIELFSCRLLVRSS